MKELISTQEKAKRYDEAIKKVNDYYEGKTKLYSDVDKTLNYLFPELKESEDERIIQWIRKELEDKYVTDNIVNNEMADKALAWLEKQGEQTTVDKIKPKFHEGEWITNGDYTWQIVMVKSLDYILQSQGGNIVEDTISHVDEHFHSFVIQDAKDGDVLRIRNLTFIFQEITNNNACHKDAVVARCSYMDNDGAFGVSGPDCITDLEIIIPATKEQRDLLFQKMKEAGYEWDTEKKELKIIDWSKYIKYEPNSPSITKEQSTWSKEDERMLDIILNDISYAQKNFSDSKLIPYDRKVAWLKTFKNRVQPKPKKEWGDEDEEIFNELIAYFISDTFLNHTEEDIVNWLKSLKERVSNFDEGYKVGFSAAKYIQWQPSEDVYKK